MRKLGTLLLVAAPFVAWGGFLLLFKSSDGGDMFVNDASVAGEIVGTALVVASFAAVLAGAVLLVRRRQ